MKVLVDTAEEEANSLKEQIKQLELSTQHSLPAVSTVSVQPIIYTIYKKWLHVESCLTQHFLMVLKVEVGCCFFFAASMKYG